MGSFILCAVLSWVAIGSAILSCINRGEFAEQQEKKSWRPRKTLNDLELMKILKDDGLHVLIFFVMFVLIVWPFVLYIILDEGK